jgi:hypothetical protein
MYFLKLFLLTLFVSIVGATDVNREIWMKNIVQKSRELKQEVDEVFGRFSERCDFKPSTDRDYEQIVSDYLNNNFTLSHENPQVSQNKEQVTTTTIHPTTTDHQFKNHNQTAVASHHRKESFLTKLKHVLGSLFGKSSGNRTETRLKRCLVVHLANLSLLEEQSGYEVVNASVADIQEIDKFVQNFIRCLSLELNITEKCLDEANYTENVTRSPLKPLDNTKNSSGTSTEKPKFSVDSVEISTGENRTLLRSQRFLN